MSGRKRGVKSSSYRVALDGKWSLSEFSDFFHVYAQAYSLSYAIVIDDDPSTQLVALIERFPWRGGYSTVNFYRDAFKMVPLRNRPEVTSIAYASPGTIDLALFLAAALNIRKIVKQLVKSGEYINSLYSSIHRGLQERRMLKLDIRERELELARRHVNFIADSYKQLSEAMQIEKPELLLKASPNNLAALKILLSLYRRVRKLAELEASGKMTL